MSAIATATRPVYSEAGPTARRLGVSTSVLHKWRRAGLIDPLVTTGGLMLFTEDDIAALTRLREGRARARIAGRPDRDAA